MWSCPGSNCWLPAVFRCYTTVCIFLCHILPLYELSALQHRFVCHLALWKTPSQLQVTLWILISISMLSFTGMFPYAMMITTPLFCYTDWPRRFFAYFPAFFSTALPFTTLNIQPSTSCVYPQIQTTSSEHQETPPAAKAFKPRLKHKLGAIFTILYIIEQFFMPYSHFITQVPKAAPKKIF